MSIRLPFPKRTAWCVLVLLLIGSGAYAQSMSGQLKKADSLVQKGNDAGALQIYKSVLQKDSSQKEALAHTAILLVRAGERQKNASKAMPLYDSARQLSLTALRTDPNYVPAAYGYALALYSLSMEQGVKEKVKGLKDVKDYLDRVLMLDSAFGKAWYLSGRWNMAFNKLNFAERAAVKLLFGGMPDAGAVQAVSCFAQCKKLEPAFIRNYYYMASALHVTGKDLQAIAVLKEAIHLRPILKDDRTFQQKCRDMIEALH